MKAIIFSFFLVSVSFFVKAQNTTHNDGKYTAYYKSGKIRSEGNYLNNKGEGEWLFYYENGKIALRKNFSNGQQVGEWSYYNTDGSIAMKIDDISKIDEAVEISQYKNNKLQSKSAFVNGKKQNTETNINSKF